jgi:hypothetical protein
MNVTRNKLAVVIATAIGACLALGGGGYALGATSSAPAVVRACYLDRAPHTLVRDATCPKGYTALSWSVTGPAGKPGPRGARGPSTAGPSGLDVIEVTHLSWDDSFALCPASHPYPVGGGGYAASGDVGTPVLMESAPGVYGDTGPQNGPPDGWSVSGGNAVTGVLETFYAFALCAR